MMVWQNCFLTLVLTDASKTASDTISTIIYTVSNNTSVLGYSEKYDSCLCLDSIFIFL